MTIVRRIECAWSGPPTPGDQPPLPPPIFFLPTPSPFFHFFFGPKLRFFLPPIWPHHFASRFTNDILPAIQIRWKFHLAVIPLLAIRSQHFFCTYHDSTAAVPCAKFCSDHCIRIEVRVKQNCLRISIAVEKTLLKRAPGQYTTMC